MGFPFYLLVQPKKCREIKEIRLKTFFFSLGEFLELHYHTALQQRLVRIKDFFVAKEKF